MMRRFLLINLIVFLFNFTQAQDATPTESIIVVSGSTSIFSVPKTTITELSSNLFSGISITPTANTQATQIIFVTGCNTCTSVSPTATIIDDNAAGSKLTSEQLGGIIGGCAGALLLIMVSVFLICFKRRKNKKKDMFETGLKTSLDLDNNVTKPKVEREIEKTDKLNVNNRDKSIKRYNLSHKSNSPPEKVIPPVILYSDSLNRQQQQDMGVEKYMLDENYQRKGSESNGARLSKYNFLSQAFSQMRTSYANEGVNRYIDNNKDTFEDHPMSPVLSTKDDAYHDPMVLPPTKKPAKYQMYSMYHDSNSEMMGNNSPSPPPATHSNSTFFHNQNDPTRESAMTVGTLHAPLFLKKYNNKSPSPNVPKHPKLYTSQLNVSPIVRSDSALSDVSDYSMYKPSSNNGRDNNNNNNSNNKQYPSYF